MTRRYPFQSAHANKQRMIKKKPKSVKKVAKTFAITSSSVNPSPDHRLKPLKTLKVRFKLKTATNLCP
jgi:hypothetical protein